MPLWKQILLTLYYHASRPVRAWDYWLAASRDRLPVMVLFYHRIADDLATPWTISNAMFFRQIQWLRERFEIITLTDAQQRIRRGYNPQPCLCITFDDGYADNCQQAVPWLIKERLPCTYFVTCRNVLAEEPFSHDLVRGHRFTPNSVEQLKAMAAAGIEIGAHGYTHTDLGPISDPRLLHCEIVTARDELAAAIGRPIRYLAFPFGQHEHLNTAAFVMARQAGYAGVCSAYGGYNFPGDDPFHLQRIPAEGCMIQLKNWVTMDRRKLAVPRFQYPSNDYTQSNLIDKTHTKCEV